MVSNFSTLEAYPLLRQRVVAAPSWVMAGTIAENSTFLCGKVDEIGLCFFEMDSCLRYGAEDLPPDLSALNLSWHVHLPLDLPWGNINRCVDSALALMEKVTYLGASRAVLHPPDSEKVTGSSADALAQFVEGWRAAGRRPEDLLLENIRNGDLTDVWSVITEYGCNVCLDMGHMIAYRQYHTLSLPKLCERVKMVHCNAPAYTSERHLPLTALNPKERDNVLTMLRHVPDDAVIMMELFTWNDIVISLPVLEEWLSARGDTA